MNLELSPWSQVEAPAYRPSVAKRPLRIQLYAMMLAFDLLCVSAAVLSGALLRFGQVMPDGWVGVSGAILALYSLAALGVGAYSLDVLRHPMRGVARATGAWMLAFALLFLLSYFLKVDQKLSRLMTGATFLFGFAALALVRQAAGDAMRRRYRNTFTNDILLVDGPPLRAPRGVVTLNARDLDISPDPSDAAMLIRLSDLLRGADRVIVSCSRAAAVRWAQMLKGSDIQGEILTRDYDDLAPLGVAELGGRTTLVVSTGPLNFRQRLVKRGFDLALTVPALLVLLPVFALVALAIKLDSRGPVFFRQPRVGHGNILFKIFKFRTMRSERTDMLGNRSASRDDDRVTRVGKFLRKTSLDELPQLLNVLLGSMSVVGPRPHALGSLAGDQLFWHVDERYWHRHALKPGITGLAQVRGFRGATETREHLTSRLQADLEYMSGWSLWRDISIVVRTARVLVHPEAY
ncbi:exopolysaccharide biosynthesis polyprenyl glycosylphosphotransferase [Sphingomonas sp. LHG3406-1]|uniref:exopolysaccharide biosynthesis polyprenyl glycosylphosphotransferase n=1 Tax=Sphingomonas sp. LHG3406-1 TaxID=2804617 RepID=UPI002604B349|nr:exopolysaccharide biosynthesis polyprenyl glycosylphosphotransferase [Sphingomonas sp. LHG3406-1]